MRGIPPIRTWALVLCLCLVFGACETLPEPDAAATVTDSAGVRIVLTPAGPEVFAEVDPEPVLSIGGPDATGPAQFQGIRGIHVDSRGRLWVADSQSGEVRIFREDGSSWKTLGGRGEGPGEFLRLVLLSGFRRDSVAAWDDGLGRLSVFDAEGELVRTQLLLGEDGVPFHGAGVFEDGTLLGQIRSVLRAADLRPGQLLGDSVRLMRISPRDSSQLPVAGALGPTWIWTGRGQVPLPFTVSAGFDVRGERLYLVQGPEFRVRAFEDGHLVGIFGVDRAPRGVTETEIEEYETFVRDFIPPAQRDSYRSASDHPEVPQHLPAYSRVLAGPDGRVWARLYEVDPEAPGVWDVFGREGEWLGQVTMPSGFAAMILTEDRLIGIWRDENRVEHLRVYLYHSLEG